MKKKNRKINNKKSVLIIIIVISVFLLLSLGYYLYNVYIEKNKLRVILTDKLTVEVNKESKIQDFVKDIVNGELINKDDIVDTSHVGEVNLKLILKDKHDEEEKYSFMIKVIDDEKPLIEAKKEISSYVSNKIDLLKDVKVVDNSGEEIVAKVVGDYDINKEGKYNLKYEAVDSSGNKGEYDFILNIVSDPNNRTFTTSKGYIGKVIDGVTYIDGVLIANKSYKLPQNYGNGLTWDTQNAFNKMHDDASKLGYNLYIGSGYRSYWDQNAIYNNYVRRDGQAGADTYSARAGHSEHQTGLAIDVCDRNVWACVSSGFDSTEQAKWISENCYKYGLILRYLKGKENVTGYMYESWHLRYVGVELARKLYNNGDWITLEEYYGIDSKYS